MIRSVLILLLLLVLSACSTPRPAHRNDKVRTGEETAKAAADAARDAESEGNTGLLVASSNQGDEPEEAASQPTTQPVEEPATTPDVSEMTPTLRVKFVKGTLTQGGEPIVDFAKVCADAVAAEPETSLIIEADTQTKHKKVMEAIDVAKKAGIQKFSLDVNDAEENTPDAVEAKPARKKAQEKDTK